MRTYSPANSVDVTKADSDLADAFQAMWVGTGGDLTYRLSGDTANHVLKNVPSGTYLVGSFIRIAVATTAADIVGFF